MWLYKEKEFKLEEHDIEHTKLFGFIYIITDIKTGQFYIGKKNLEFKRKTKLPKKTIALQTGKGRKKLTTIVIKKSDWENYYSSSEHFKQISKERPQDIKREIIHLCYNTTSLTYHELKYMFKYDALENQMCVNKNISGRFFREKI